MMLVPPLLIEKYRVPFEVIFLWPAEDQLNKSCGRRSPLYVPETFKCDPRPITSSISCSVARCASKEPALVGRMNWHVLTDLALGIRSKGLPWPTVSFVK